MTNLNSLSKEQLFWYELNKAAAVIRDELYKFLSEYPSEPEEAFQNSGRSIFTVATLDRLASQARPIKDLWVVRPRAELLADKEALVAEYRQSQAEVSASRAGEKLRQQSQVLQVNQPQTVREETPTVYPIEQEPTR